MRDRFPDVRRVQNWYKFGGRSAELFVVLANPSFGRRGISYRGGAKKCDDISVLQL